MSVFREQKVEENQEIQTTFVSAVKQEGEKNWNQQQWPRAVSQS